VHAHLWREIHGRDTRATLNGVRHERKDVIKETKRAWKLRLTMCAGAGHGAHRARGGKPARQHHGRLLRHPDNLLNQMASVHAPEPQMLTVQPGIRRKWQILRKRFGLRISV